MHSLFVRNSVWKMILFPQPLMQPLPFQQTELLLPPIVAVALEVEVDVVGGRGRGRYHSGNQTYHPSPHQHSGPPQQGGPQQQSPTGPPTPSFPGQYQQHDHHPHCQICQKVGHTAIDCYHRMDFAYQGRIPSSRLAAMVASPGFDDQSTWYADASATHHITSNLSNLDIRSRYGGSDSVQVGNGQGLPIAHTGSTLLPSPSKHFHLKNILHCPTAATNLLSVQKFSLDNHCYFCFDDSGFLVKDKATGRTLYKGSTEHGLYPFHPTSCRPTAFHSRVSSDLWHARLGHPSLTIQKNILRNFNFPISNKHSSFCSSCQLGKSKRLPFPLSVSSSSSPLEILHSDVWGPSPISSVTGYRFYLLFVDDFTKYCWIYPMHHKSDAFSLFIKFKSIVENTMNTKIKNFRSDGGGEYVNKTFEQFLAHNGITHQLYCPYTPEQNGVAERKHRHIIETSLTLLAHSHVPTKYWLDAFNTAVFLINRMVLTPSSPQSPYEKLFCHSPDYSSLRVFGCACFPWLRPYVQNKLCLHSTKCVFIGYSPAHKGYRCLDPITGRVYVSRHVTFDENTFPFNECSSSGLPDQQVPEASWFSGPLSRWLPSPHPSVNPQSLLPIPTNILSSSTLSITMLQLALNLLLYNYHQFQPLHTQCPHTHTLPYLLHPQR
eukprot:TRINITY_DN16169_c0_g1_i2.p1 TRINITY_DN16169_c0_g1~~TRINITY_DN16169_c0_g1_i2.p1  ORF type:complete len:660 (-),score=55.01 TRINITY_DN16169_c0_g1_i2:23-2002(-)